MLEGLLNKLTAQDPRQAAIRKAFEALTYPKKIKDLAFSKAVLAASLPEQREWLLALILALRQYEKAIDRRGTWHQRWELRQLVFSLLKRKLPFTAQDMLVLAEWSDDLNFYQGAGGGAFIKACETYFKSGSPPHDPAVLAALQKLADRLDSRNDPGVQRFLHKLSTLLEEAGAAPGPRRVVSPLAKGDPWADSAMAEITALDLAAANTWNTLLGTCAQAKNSAPSAKWLAQARAERQSVGAAAVRAALLRWFALVDAPRQPHLVELTLERISPQYREHYREAHRWEMHTINGDILKGLLWLCADQDDPELARAVSKLVRDAFRKIPGVGPRLARVGNAGLWTLGQMPGMGGVAQLAILKTRLKMPNMQKQIASAFDQAARRLGLSQAEIEELAVPTYGLGENGQPPGVRIETFEGYRAEIRTLNGEPVLRWFKDGQDKPLSAAPQAVKSAHPDEVKDLTQTVKDLRGLLTAQKDRLDGLFLAQQKWDYATWRERYLDHPLVGTLARRLIWKFSAGDRAASGIWLDGQLVGRDSAPLDWLDDSAVVELWHPLHTSSEVVLEWRAFLSAHEVQQPFKQAHREVYLLTDAERNTRTYSNRFAAHILRQHQFNALCAARGWKNSLRLMVDDSYPPATRTLPLWNLRAEYWVEGIGDNYGTDTNETGTYLYLTTDQVRFYRIDAPGNYAHAGGGGYGSGRWGGGAAPDPLPLEEIPALVLSEVLRDVDLFVGVASVGNDPNWLDGGDRRHDDYWNRYSFGALSETAKTRRAVLDMLLPRLKIAERCTLGDKFLVVRGDLRTYKIHLGSGNILMEPNDQYLCIVPGRGVSGPGSDRLFLPFEGDQTLAIILSKAFLLADDKKITDPTITRQLKR